MSSAVLDLSSFFASPSPAPNKRSRLPDPVDEFRLRLSVRGWVPPLELLGPEHDKAAALRILDAVASEVETSSETRPGLWYLSVAARRQEVIRRSISELRSVCEVLFEGDLNDPVLKAFVLAIDGESQSLAEIDTPVLQALAGLCVWIGKAWHLPFGELEVAGELAARSLDANLQRMTRQPLVGRLHRGALAALIKFATEPSSSEGLCVSYVYGSGGSGKTTLLAFLHLDLRLRMPVVRIDFDEPSIDPRRMVTLNLALCEQLAAVVPDIGHRLDGLRHVATLQSYAGHSRAGQRRPDAMARLSTLKETYISESSSDEGSILYGMLRSVAGPVTIIFDTAELVLARSDADASGLVRWLGFLQSEAGASDIRIVIAGRDPSDAGEAGINLMARLEAAGASIREPIELPELVPDEAAELLRNCGIADETVVSQAANAVPGNPLLLRITGDALMQNDSDLREAVRNAHRQSRIDPDSARNYLLRRVVAHVSDPFARPYVLAAAFSPLISVEFIEHVVIPCVDRQAQAPQRRFSAPTGEERKVLAKSAVRIFEVLANTHWLTRPSNAPEGWVAFNRDVRALSLKLMAVTEDGISLERDFRQSATIFHQARRSPVDRALALYHRALLGHPVRLPRERKATRELLVDVLSELPAALRQDLENDGLNKPSETTAPALTYGPSAHMTASQWMRYLEGDEKHNGEGHKLVESDHAREALELYLHRPTRPQGNPPTFILQALADLGDWGSGIVDVDSVLYEDSNAWLSSNWLSQTDLTRIYWISRLALMRDCGHLSERHVDVLRRVSADRRGAKLTALAALACVAEAVRGEPFMDAEMRMHALKGEPTPRVVLAAWASLSSKFTSLEVADIAVAQKDWAERASSVRLALGGKADMTRLQKAQEHIQKLEGQPMARVNLVFSRLRERVRVEPLKLKGSARTLLLRGLTTEFHRPLREALLSLRGQGQSDDTMRSLFGPTLEGMSVRPLEMEAGAFSTRFRSNPRAWCSAFVSYADRCRLLPGLCRQIVERGENAMAKRIATGFLSWDSALCRGESSDWRQNL